MSRVYHQGHREVQDQFDARRLADRVEEVLCTEELAPAQQGWIAARDMFFLATADGSGQPSCTYKGGEPGFVRVLDAHTLAWPSYDGNGMFISAGNLRLNPLVGLLFVDLEKPRRIRVSGEASVDPADPLLAEFPGAQFVTRLRITLVYANCGRYVHTYRKVEESRFVPRANVETPQPGWKQEAWARDVLPGTRDSS